jgi:[acyl-carrier-protein] S-malonyltransferase
MTAAFIFPGQGSQEVGMGRDLAAAHRTARDVFEEVDDALRQRLFRLMTEGPAADLELTENAQPALMAMSLAIMAVLQKDAGLNLEKFAMFVAGHSLGEYSALTAARSFSIAAVARLLKTRGRAMQQAVPVGAGAMAALLGADPDQARDLAAAAADGEVCSPANDNAPGQVVISGAKAAIERAMAMAKDKGIRKALLLPVSAPFHCAMMQPAADAMAEALSTADLRRPIVPLIANVTAGPVDDPETVRKLLVEQVTAPVRWRESVLAMKAGGVTKLVEIGAGKVLTGLAKRIDKELEAVAVGTPAEIEAFVKTI